MGREELVKFGHLFCDYLIVAGQMQAQAHEKAINANVAEERGQAHVHAEKVLHFVRYNRIEGRWEAASGIRVIR